MCGILFSTIPSVNAAEFRAALHLMHHRGPDASGCVAQHGAVLLGHNRLSIVDLNSRSNQPFYSADRRFVTIYNGEIYNYRELVVKHHLDGSTTSDTEVLLELYLKKGEKMLEELIGMFAFVIFDTQTGDYFMARDRLGVKPLYVMENVAGLIVSSEIAPILKLFPSQSVDEFSVRQFRKMRGFFNGRTLYTGVKMFPAGYCRYNRTSHAYWTLPKGDQCPPSDEELKTLLRSSVDYRCIADVPVGSYLSGGLDSSIVAAMAPVTHTWVVGMPSLNEFDWAKLVASKLGRVHHETTVTAEQFLETVNWMVRRRHEPLAVPNEVLLYLMTKAVKRENTVILSGEGADELFAGYDRVFRWASNAPQWDLNKFTELYAYGSADDLEVVEDAVAPFLDRGSVFAIVSAFFQISHLHGLLRRLDNSTMLCSVEGRVPFVDHRLVERLAGVSFAYKHKEGVVKAPLKRVFGELLPHEVVHRPKMGFPVDLSSLIPAQTLGATPSDKWFNYNLGLLGIEAK